MEGIRFLLQCVPLSEHPTLFLMHLYRFAEHVLVGVMFDLEAHYLPVAATLGGVERPGDGDHLS